ncbi:MAG: CpsD/CapB family tyrosine-protein kinase [Nitrospinales bacterium]
METLESCRKIINSILSNGLEKGPRAFLVTSSVAGEGASAVAVNLAKFLAKYQGMKVCLIDANSRNPSLHAVFDFENYIGFSDVAAGKAGLLDVLQRTEVPHLAVITSGPDNLGNLEPQKTRSLIQQLNARFDCLIFDSSPVSDHSDPLALASLVDGVILVVHAGKTRWEVVQNAKEQLLIVHANILGVVLNQRKYYIPEFIYRKL